MTQANNLHVNTAQERVKAMVFANIVSFIEKSLKDGVYIFTLSEVHKTYQDCLLNSGSDVQINKSCLITELLEHFQNLAVQEQYDGRSCLLVFPVACMKFSKPLSYIRTTSLKPCKLQKLQKISVKRYSLTEVLNFLGHFHEIGKTHPLPLYLGNPLTYQK